MADKNVLLDKNTNIPLYVAISGFVMIIPILVWAIRADVKIEKVPKIERIMIRMDKRLDRLEIKNGTKPKYLKDISEEE